MGKVALITGITGQDGAYLSRLLLDKGYTVHGTFRRTASSLNLWRMDELGIRDQVDYLPLEMTEFANIMRVVDRIQPDEIYNLAAQSFVHDSFEQPLYTSTVNGMAVVYFLEVIREQCPGVRLYQASSSELFGKAVATPQTETTPFYPRSPYAVAKLFAHWMVVNYREAYGLHASAGILFNHESPLRGLGFVTRKITAGLARIRLGRQEALELGNLEARRDWGYAGDFVEGIWRMVQQERPGDYVLATGRTHSVRELVTLAAACAGFDLAWEGDGVATRGIDRASGRTLVRINPALFRPTEVGEMTGDARLARAILGWTPRVTFEELVESMVKADLDRAGRGEIVN
ncbi:MAG: GDP-mannose 4,6-dehydratase [Magnetococcales bacterium]|nr:GDP-mannose 4,6-dehydratase [Magnetococcales bacterium]